MAKIIPIQVNPTPQIPEGMAVLDLGHIKMIWPKEDVEKYETENAEGLKVLRASWQEELEERKKDLEGPFKEKKTFLVTKENLEVGRIHILEKVDGRVLVNSEIYLEDYYRVLGQLESLPLERDDIEDELYSFEEICDQVSHIEEWLTGAEDLSFIEESEHN